MKEPPKLLESIEALKDYQRKGIPLMPHQKQALKDAMHGITVTKPLKSYNESLFDTD